MRDKQNINWQGAGPWSAPLAGLYGAIIRARRMAYDRGVLHAHPSPCFTVSVGGLEVGGSGKTPVTGYLLQRLINLGRTPGLLSRGYGRQSTGLQVRLRGQPANPEQLGDEPAMLVSTGLDIAVAVCAQRTVGAQALATQGCDTLVLDDGFAHRALQRHVDIVVLRGEQPFASGRLLPRGRLREPPSSLQRAHIVWMHYRTAAPDGPTPAWFAQHCPQALRVVSQALPGVVRDLQGKQINMAGRRVIACAGIAWPADVESSLMRLGADVAAMVPFADHHPYGAADMDHLLRLQRRHSAEAIVTTAKDAVKLVARWPSVPLWVLTHEVDVRVGEAQLMSWLAAGSLRNR